MSDISFGIGGDNAEWFRALTESQAAANEAVEAIKGSFEGLTAAFESVSGALGVFTAVLAGGAAFKEAIEATVELTTGAQALGRQFGIGATAASELRVALDDAHVSTETFSTAGNALIRTLNTNEAALKAAGVATRDSTGEFRNQLDILLDVTTHLATLKEGTDRNIEGIRLFGKAWAEAAPVVKVTSERLQEAAEKAEALGLTVGTEQVAEVAAYRAAMNDVSDVMTGIKNAIGQAVMPALTQLGEWFGSIGPGLVETFRIAMAALALPFREVALVARVFYETVKTFLIQLADYSITFGKVFNKAIRGDFSGATEAWREGMAQIEQVGNDYWNKIVQDAKDTQDKIAQSFATAIVGPTVTRTQQGGGGAAEDDMKKQMELLKEMEKLEDQHAQLRLRQISTQLEESDRILSAEQADEAAMQRQIDLTKQQTALNDKDAESRLRSITTSLTASELFLSKQEEEQKEFEKRWSGAFKTFENAFGTAISNMIRGGMSFGQSMRNVFASIAEAALENTVKNMAAMAMGALFSDTLRSAQIRKDAGAAAAGAYKAIVGIPYVGPFLAPAAAAVAYAGVLAFESAEGGYDIPSGHNPVVQTHAREMILPEKYADVIRAQANGGGGTHVNIYGGRNASFSRDQLAAMLKDMGHSFSFR